MLIESIFKVLLSSAYSHNLVYILNHFDLKKKQDSYSYMNMQNLHHLWRIYMKLMHDHIFTHERNQHYFPLSISLTV